MEGKEEDVRLGANKFTERQPIGTSAQTDKDYKEPPPAPVFEPGELSSWSFYRAGIAEFIATFLFLYITVLTVMGVSKSSNKCATVGTQGIAWAFGGMIFALVYCTAGISGNRLPSSLFFFSFTFSGFELKPLWVFLGFASLCENLPSFSCCGYFHGGFGFYASVYQLLRVVV